MNIIIIILGFTFVYKLDGNIVNMVWHILRLRMEGSPPDM